MGGEQAKDSDFWKVDFVRNLACPAGWTKYDGKCYKCFTDKQDWKCARDKCLSHQVTWIIITDHFIFIFRLIWSQSTMLEKMTLSQNLLGESKFGLVVRELVMAAKVLFGLMDLPGTSRVGTLESQIIM